jgi:hypothetical protein
MLTALWMKNQSLIYPVLFLIITFPSAIFFSLKYFDIIWSLEQSITIMISILGLLFAIFQVWLNIVVQNIRDKAALRHIEFKELIKLLNSISEIVNNSMTTNNTNIDGVVSVLFNKQTEFASFMNSNDSYLFENFRFNIYLNKAFDDLLEMIRITDNYRAELDKKANDDLMEIINHVSWHNDIRESLGSFNQTKQSALVDMHKYLR